MADTVLRVNNLSKRFRIVHARRHDTLRDAVANVVGALPHGRGRRGSVTDPAPRAEEFWALKDVSFEIGAGQVVGIIGRNGAGKSTLLKILSRITRPTAGSVEIRGRVGSLLEVGTGFHPELSGRENIYLNGAILGMRRVDIARRFDEIVAFAEVDRFLDTPVKHYSSGMYARLAFAVAAHMEPDVLLVDEILAVGDAEFQKKCLGKMGHVAEQGRTVLFVSHNMGAVVGLCDRAVLLHHGRLHTQGPTDSVVQTYVEMAAGAVTQSLRDRVDRVGDGRVRFTAIAFLDDDMREVSTATCGASLNVALDFESRDGRPENRLSFEIGVYSLLDDLVFLCGSDFAAATLGDLPPSGRVLCRIARLPLAPGVYTVNIYCGSPGRHADWVKQASRLEVVAGDFFGTGRIPPANAGVVMVPHEWRWAETNDSGQSSR